MRPDSNEPSWSRDDITPLSDSQEQYIRDLGWESPLTLRDVMKSDSLLMILAQKNKEVGDIVREMQVQLQFWGDAMLDTEFTAGGISSLFVIGLFDDEKLNRLRLILRHSKSILRFTQMMRKRGQFLDAFFERKTAEMGSVEAVRRIFLERWIQEVYEVLSAFQPSAYADMATIEGKARFLEELVPLLRSSDFQQAFAHWPEGDQETICELFEDAFEAVKADQMSALMRRMVADNFAIRMAGDSPFTDATRENDREACEGQNEEAEEKFDSGDGWMAGLDDWKKRGSSDEEAA